MFSLFSTVPDGPNFHPVSERSDLFGRLENEDLEWTCATGFVTETQTFYHFIENETMIICQVIHSYTGLWPNIQFTCKIYKPDAKEPSMLWSSVSASNFMLKSDKRSCEADQFSVTYGTSKDADYPESYVIKATLQDESQISLVVKRPASIPGFKIGNGPKGGFSYLGFNQEKPDGYVVHRFWPHTIASGMIVRNGERLEMNGIGMMVHAIQGMRPDLIASRWNFANFQSNLHGGVSAIQMEFTTVPKYGRRPESGGVTVNVGSIVLGGKLAVVTAETKWPGEEQSTKCETMSRAIHRDPKKDKDTGYYQPSSIDFIWAGQSMLESEGASGRISASLTVDVGGPISPKGLVEKVDVMKEIPTAVKMLVNWVAGTKPYVYQWQNRVKLKVSGPEIIPGLSDGLEIDGLLFNEASFISP